MKILNKSCPTPFRDPNLDCRVAVDEDLHVEAKAPLDVPRGVGADFEETAVGHRTYVFDLGGPVVLQYFGDLEPRDGASERRGNGGKGGAPERRFTSHRKTLRAEGGRTNWVPGLRGRKSD
jgi:hypothetical protein